MKMVIEEINKTKTIGVCENDNGDDYLYHIGLNPKEDDLQKFFHDVKFVCMGGSVGRMEEFAQSVADELGKFVIFFAKIRDFTFFFLEASLEEEEEEEEEGSRGRKLFMDFLLFAWGNSQWCGWRIRVRLGFPR